VTLHISRNKNNTHQRRNTLLQFFDHQLDMSDNLQNPVVFGGIRSPNLQYQRIVDETKTVPTTAINH